MKFLECCWTNPVITRVNKGITSTSTLTCDDPIEKVPVTPL